MGATYIVPALDKRAAAERIAAVVRRILDVRTGGRYGGRDAEVGELAAEIGCSKSSVYSMLGARGGLGRQRCSGRGYHALTVFLPRLDVVIRLCQVADVSADWLLLGKGRAPSWWYAQQRGAA